MLLVTLGLVFPLSQADVLCFRSRNEQIKIKIKQNSFIFINSIISGMLNFSFSYIAKVNNTEYGFEKIKPHILFLTLD